MENKDLMLLEELIKLAKYIFTNYVTLNIEGKFTAAELSNCKDSLGRKLMISYTGHDDDIHEINFDWGGYSLPTYKIFDMLYAMEKIKNEPDYIFGLLEKFDFSFQCELNAIFVDLFDALKSERTNNTPKQRKSENEPEKAVICESEKIDTSAKDFNKHEALKATEKRMREKRPDYIALIRYNGMYYSYGESAKEVRFANGVLDYITDTGDYICFNESLLDDVLPKLIKAGRGVLTCDIIENEPQQEDYPPEPYNKEKSENVATSYERFQDRTICGRFQKNMRPNYLLKKVFPYELFNARRKISRFKTRYFVIYTSYHLCKESALERERISNTSVYRVLIRGETKNKYRTIVFNSE